MQCFFTTRHNAFQPTPVDSRTGKATSSKRAKEMFVKLASRSPPISADARKRSLASVRRFGARLPD